MSVPALRPGAARIRGRTPEGWVVGTRLYKPTLLVTGDLAGTIAGLSWPTLDLLALPDLPMVELLLLGTGRVAHQPTDALLTAAHHRGWRLETMDSAAAARTFNVLAAEGRLVGALLFGDEPV